MAKRKVSSASEASQSTTSAHDTSSNKRSKSSSSNTQPSASADAKPSTAVTKSVGNNNRRSSTKAINDKVTTDKSKATSSTATETQDVTTADQSINEMEAAVIAAQDIITVSQINKLEQQILSSTEHSKHILTLIAIIQQLKPDTQSTKVTSIKIRQAKPELICAALQSLHRIFDSKSESRDVLLCKAIKPTSSSSAASESENAETIAAHRKWLQAQYDKYIDTCLSLISCTSVKASNNNNKSNDNPSLHSSIRLSCLHSLMTLICSAIQQLRDDKVHSSSRFDFATALSSTIFSKFIFHSIFVNPNVMMSTTTAQTGDNPHNNSIYIQQLLQTYVQPYDDVRMAVLKLIKSYCDNDNVVEYVNSKFASNTTDNSGNWSSTTDNIANVNFTNQQITQCLYDVLIGITCDEVTQTNYFNPNYNAADRLNVDDVISDSDDTSHKSSKRRDPTLSLSHKSRQLLSGCWMSLLSSKHELSLPLYKTLLQQLHTHVFPRITSPLLLADFLTDSYAQGGIISVLSLNALFILISKYNLQYPEFYPKLYSLLTSEIFYVKYRSRFFNLLSLFLTSQYLPSQYVASFAKRLSRLALYAPVYGSAISIVIVFNLLRRHPACRVLMNRPLAPNSNSNNDSNGEINGGESSIHNSDVGSSLTEYLLKRQAELEQERIESEKASKKNNKNQQQKKEYVDSDDDEMMNEQNNKSSVSVIATSKVWDFEPLPTLKAIDSDCLGIDKFNDTTLDITLTNATSSSLWEIHSLTHHYSPIVSQLAKTFTAANAPKKDLELSKYLTYNYTQLFEKESNRRSQQKVQLAYDQPQSLLDNAPLFKQCFKL